MGGKQALVELRAEVQRRSDEAWVGVSDEPDGEALWMSDGAWADRPAGAARSMSGGVVLDASGELGGEVQ